MVYPVGITQGLYKRYINKHQNMKKKKRKEKGEKMNTLFREIQELELQTRPKGITEKQELIEKKEELAALLKKSLSHN